MDMWSVLFIGTIIMSLVASGLVNSTFRKYNKVHTRSGVTAAQVAREILDDNGLCDIAIVETPGSLSDHYNPRTKTVALSQTVYNNSTIGAIGVAAHEVGHAIQHGTDYLPIKARSLILPLANIGTQFWYVVLIIGIMFEAMQLVWVAIGLYAFSVAFQLVTLPVEINASRRALRTLSDKRYLDSVEISGARKVLTAAAFTYVAAFVMSLVRLLSLITRHRRSD